MSCNQKISETIDGILVTGIITFRSESDISVRIMSPFIGLTGQQHIPYFSRPFNSYLTEYGDTVAVHLLKQLSDLGSYIDKNKAFLKLQLSLHFYGCEYSNEDCQKRFFDSSFPFLVPYSLKGQVMGLLT
ncbi:MAG: hypothetical protein HON27_00060 [Candidatus Marinimicrobia bacterium]|nr:hypothetical protein [Candidatus Neomarinimicrobiota bacterium]MBT4944541.1 hypothetical protein [Candidatus Neomarinimicrobiota bacterium]MBT5269962.1 hypothetical protein [Candidatus Neomarinimicrobiota bacterium]